MRFNEGGVTTDSAAEYYSIRHVKSTRYRCMQCITTLDIVIKHVKRSA